MCDSSRPVRTMPVVSNSPVSRRVAALFRRLPVRALAALPLALVAVVPAHAAHRTAAKVPAHAAMNPASHSTAPASRSTRSIAKAAPVAHGAKERREAEDVATAPHRGKAAPARPLSRQERAQAEAEAREEQRAEALEALHRRANRYAAVKGRTVAAKTAEKPKQVADVDERADRRTEDRVHAWYRANHSRVSADEAENTPVATYAKTLKPAPAQTVAANVAPDLSTSPRKATSDDFARAAAAQRNSITAVHEQQSHQTTADDDNADAESRIPSTAPTEREPAPFVHGSFGVDGTQQPVSEIVPATRALRAPAPVVRQAPAPAATAALAPPQHVDLKHRGDGLSTAIAAETAKSAQHANIPEVTAADSSPSAVRALEADTANSPTPRLKLPAPPAAALHKDLPAVAAVQSAAKKKDLDPAVAAGMAEETFDEDDTPATARTAVALTKPVPAAMPVVSRVRNASATDEDADGAPTIVMPVNLFDRQGHLVMVPPMKGSHEILVHQNQMAVSDGLARIQDDGDLLELRQRKLLVALPDEESVYPDDRLPANRRYARPWTVRFIRDLARAHYTRFGTPLVVTSAARTVAFQRRLVRVNGNAAPPTGEIASPHLYGQAIDIAKGRMSLTELMWMRAYLTPVENDGKIDVEEEFQQSCFHVSVYRRYLGLPAPRQTPAQQLQRPLLTAEEKPATESGKPEKKHRRISAAMLATGLR